MLSLGTSDTLFASSSRPSTLIPIIPTFVFQHPLYSGTFISLLCYKNGSQVRERLCKHYCGGDWEQFGYFIESAPVGNNGIFGLIYDTEEITPPSLQGRYFFNSTVGEMVREEDLDPAFIVRSLIEGQLLAKYNHSKALNSGDSLEIVPSTPKLLVTGGASANKSILQVASDIFGLPLYTIDIANSASLGAVIRSVYATESINFTKEFTEKVAALSLVCEPINHKVYKKYYKLFNEFSKGGKVS